ncbi:MAG TPA: hypothetical protein VFA30_05350 [Gaiellaceae bacterium]|nr:hypothetical protein [Gaiellaceae bacterium]
MIGAVLVAPVVILDSGSSGGPRCSTTILYKGNRYEPRPTGRLVEAVAVGVGVASGCGTPSNVDLRTIAGVRPAVAVALGSEPATAYVRRGLCAGLTRAKLLTCLRGL